MFFWKEFLYNSVLKFMILRWFFPNVSFPNFLKKSKIEWKAWFLFFSFLLKSINETSVLNEIFKRDESININVSQLPICINHFKWEKIANNIIGRDTAKCRKKNWNHFCFNSNQLRILKFLRTSWLNRNYYSLPKLLWLTAKSQKAFNRKHKDLLSVMIFFRYSLSIPRRFSFH